MRKKRADFPYLFDALLQVRPPYTSWKSWLLLKRRMFQIFGSRRSASHDEQVKTFK